MQALAREPIRMCQHDCSSCCLQLYQYLFSEAREEQ